MTRTVESSELSSANSFALSPRSVSGGWGYPYCWRRYPPTLRRFW